MDFPYYEIQLKPRRLENGKYKARCSIRLHTGDKVYDTLSTSWEREDPEFDSEDAANIFMIHNAKDHLKREYGLDKKDLERVKISYISPKGFS